MLSNNPPKIVVFFMVLFTLHTVRGGRREIWPMPKWQDAGPQSLGLNAGKLAQARDFALTGGGSGCIIYHGYRVLQWGNQKQKYDLKSSTKSFGVTALGLALEDGKIHSLDEKAVKFQPDLCLPPSSNRKTGWIDKITLFHLATQTAGIDKPGGYHKLLFPPGSKWSYSDAGPNWLAECLTLLYKKDLNKLLFERVFTPIGIKPEDLSWRQNAYRPSKINGIWRREFGSGISANVDAMARFGYLYLRRGHWDKQQILPPSFIDMVRHVPRQIANLPVAHPESYFNASHHYGLLWWNNADGTMKTVPKDAYWSWGLYDSLIVVIPSLDIVAARAGRSLNKNWNSDYHAIEPFIAPIAAAVPRTTSPPYPPSRTIRGIKWADKHTIIRLARGSDNWPLTWADDNNLYTAYGDGWGFLPKTDKKLSLGLAKIIGSPPDIKGINIRSASGERTGQGPQGLKASGMLMVDGVLYMLARNAGNSRLAFSADHARTWQWVSWKFTRSFGCPTFINYGKNYAGAPDDYIYIVSPDINSAYQPADRMIMARVPTKFVLQQKAYEYYQGLTSDGLARWTGDFNKRGAVFVYQGKCYRSGISYNPMLKRYLWCQVIPGQDARFSGGFGIYEAPKPWGPWRTVYFTENWDVGPGETCSIPTKWLSLDGKTGYLVFSGDDCFSVRGFTFILARK